MYIPNTILFCASMNSITIILANMYVYKVMSLLIFVIGYMHVYVFYIALHIVELICIAFLE